MANEVESPPTKKTTPSSQPPPSFSTLPEGIIENCLARISKWYYPKLSLVSKTFRSLLSSPELYTLRSQIGTVETCLYMCLEFYNNQHPSWFFLHKKSLREENEISYQYSLVPLPSSSQSPPIPYRSTLAIGSKIYVIGGTEKAPSSAIRVLDCRTHTWHNAPNMTVAREEALAVLIDDNIYVIGGCKENESVNWMEVFNIKTQTWKPLTTTGAEDLLKEPHFTIKVLEGKIYAMGVTKDYIFYPEEGKWSIVKEHGDSDWIMAWCVVDNVIYCYNYVGYCLWYDWEAREWKEVKGLDFALYGFGPRSGMTMVNNGGKFVLVWDSTIEIYGSIPERSIWCGEVVLEKCEGGEIWGSFEWVNSVLKLSASEVLYQSPSCCVAISI